MIRMMLQSLVVLLLSVACLGQTFQYSRGWTNGKRSSDALNAGDVAANFHKGEEVLADIFNSPIVHRKLERCLLQLQRFVRNPLPLYSGALASSSGSNGDNNLFGDRHQPSEVFDDLNAAEASDYAKH